MKEYVQEIIDYIEDHIEERICMDDIVSFIGYSRYYLHRMFSIYTGYTIMDYIRKRKMQYALYDICQKRRILDVSIQYGYDSERSFRRAFKNVFNDIPSNLNCINYIIPSKIKLNKIGGINMLPYLSNVKEVNIPKYYAIGKRIISKEPEDEVINLMTEYKLKNNLHVISEIGSDIPISNEDSEKGFRGYVYYLVLSKKEYDLINDPLIEKIEVEASKYIMLTINNPFAEPFERIGNGWKKLVKHGEKHNTWNKDLTFSCFEEALIQMSETIMNIYIAIK